VKQEEEEMYDCLSSEEYLARQQFLEFEKKKIAELLGTLKPSLDETALEELKEYPIIFRDDRREGIESCFKCMNCRNIATAPLACEKCKKISCEKCHAENKDDFLKKCPNCIRESQFGPLEPYMQSLYNRVHVNCQKCDGAFMLKD